MLFYHFFPVRVCFLPLYIKSLYWIRDILLWVLFLTEIIRTRWGAGVLKSSDYADTVDTVDTGVL